MKRKLLLAALCVVGALGMRAQTNYVAGWDGGESTAAPTTYGWTSSNSSRSWNTLNGGGGARMMTNYSGYTLEDGSTYTYSSTSNPSSKILWIRYATDEVYTYAFTGLEPEHIYRFSGLIGWNSNGDKDQTWTVKVSGTTDYGSASKVISTAKKMYELSFQFTVPADETATSFGLKFTCSQNKDNIEAVSALQVVEDFEAYRTTLSNQIAYATALNGTLSNSTLATAITTAQGKVDDTAHNVTLSDVSALKSVIASAIADGIGEGDVSYLVNNPGFESCTVTTTNAAAIGSASPLDISGGWTQSSSAGWSSSAVVSYGGSGQVNGVSAPSADNAGNSGNTLGVSVGWGGLVTYQTPAVTLPAGVYTLQVNAYNAYADAQQFTSRFGFVPTSGSSTLSTKTSFASNTWETDKVTFTLTEATEGKIQVGGEAISGGSGSNAKVFFDNISITYSNPLAGAKKLWDDAVEAANQAKTDCPNVTGSELAALDAELAKAEPTTVEGYNAATEALTGATETFVAAKSAYDIFAAYNTTLTYADASKKPTITSETTAASLITALRAYYESNALAEKVDGAVNCADAIAGADPNTNTGWTGGIGTDDRSWEEYTDASGNAGGRYYDGGWSTGAGVNINMSRSISLPAGTYLLTVTARGSSSLTSYKMSVAGESVDLPANGSGENTGVFGHGWDDVSVGFVSDGHPVTLTIAATSTETQQWISFNRFRLMRLELNSDVYAGETEYTALNNAIADAEAKTLGFEEGQYAPYNNVAALEALAAANAIDQDAELTNFKTDVEAATTALTSATWTANTSDVDAIFNGSFSSEVEGDWGLTGWTRTNAWGQQRTDAGDPYGTAYYNQPGSLQYGNKGVYTMPLAANTWYKLSFAYRSHEDNSNNKVTVSVLNGEDGLAAKVFPGNGSKTNWKVAEQYFSTGAAGNYVLTLANDGNTWMTGVSLVKEVPPTITKTAEPVCEGYKTFYNNTDVNYEAQGDTKVYIAAEPDNGYVQLTEVGNIVPAGKAVILKTTIVNNAETDIVLTPTADNAADGAFDDNILAAATGNGTETNKYILGYLPGEGNGLGFYMYEPSLDAGDVYLNVSNTANVRLGIIVDGEATAINSVKAEAGKANEATYNMAGQRVNGSYKGIVIKNGKKYMIK